MHVAKETRGGLGGRFFKGIGRRLPVVIIFALLGAIIGMALSMFVLQPQYQAGYTIQVNGGATEEAQKYFAYLSNENLLDEALQRAGLEGRVTAHDLIISTDGDEATKQVNVAVSLPVARDAYDAAQALSEMTAEEAGADAIVTAAYYPKSTSYPDKKFNMLFGAAAGAILGLLIIILRSATDGLIRARRDVEKAFTRPVIAAVPDMSEYEDIYAPNAPWPVPDAFHTLISNLQKVLPGEGCKIVGVTDAGFTEGKERMASNIAIALGQLGKRVLLLDADFDGASVSALLSLPKEPGLLELLSGREQFRSTLLKDPLHGIYVLASGNRALASGEVVSPKKVAMLLELFRKHFDYVVISLPQADEVGTLIENENAVDGILLIVYNGASTFKEVKTSLNELSFVRDKILGFLFDEADEDESLYDAELGEAPVED